MRCVGASCNNRHPESSAGVAARGRSIMLTLQTSKPFYTSFLCIQAVPGVKSSCRNRKDGPELCFIQAQALAYYAALSNSHN